MLFFIENLGGSFLTTYTLFTKLSGKRSISARSFKFRIWCVFRILMSLMGQKDPQVEGLNFRVSSSKQQKTENQTKHIQP